MNAARWFGCCCAVAAAAALSPAIRADWDVEGLELVPQFINPDGAIFVYRLFDSQTGRLVGEGAVQVQHETPLPLPDGACIRILGGTFRLRIGRSLTTGVVDDGQLCPTANPNLFDLNLELTASSGECLTFVGTLDHTPLTRKPPRPPKVSGLLAPCP